MPNVMLTTATQAVTTDSDASPTGFPLHTRVPHARTSQPSSSTSAACEIFDDFLPADVQAAILTLMERPKWSFTGGGPPHQFWHMDGLEAEPFFSATLYGMIAERLGERVRDCEIERIYANGQTATQRGAPHTDDGDLTFLYFPNPVWKPSWGGELTFLEGDASSGGASGSGTSRPGGGDATARVLETVPYRPNRALLFPASVVHYAEAPSRNFTGLRVSLAYKLWKPRG